MWSKTFSLDLPPEEEEEETPSTCVWKKWNAVIKRYNVALLYFRLARNSTQSRSLFSIWRAPALRARA